MRLWYSYQNYPNYPRATRYSKLVASSDTLVTLFLGWLSIGVVIAFLIYTFSFFENYNWNEFLHVIAITIAAAIADIYFFAIHPKNTECDIMVIVAEDGNHNLPKPVVQQYCENLRNENKKANIKIFIRMFLIFLVGLSGAVALIATIKSVYLLCHKADVTLLLSGSVFATVVFALLLFRMLRSSSRKAHAKTTPSNKEPLASEEVAFCRKCGAKVLSDSVFCTKCGIKVR